MVRKWKWSLLAKSSLELGQAVSNVSNTLHWFAAVLAENHCQDHNGAGNINATSRP